VAFALSTTMRLLFLSTSKPSVLLKEPWLPLGMMFVAFAPVVEAAGELIDRPVARGVVVVRHENVAGCIERNVLRGCDAGALADLVVGLLRKLGLRPPRTDRR